MNTIPDIPHIFRIRDKSWCDRKYGKAAVMVGVGFSMNADKISSDVPNFPL
jgi:hypothetical protein